MVFRYTISVCICLGRQRILTNCTVEKQVLNVFRSSDICTIVYFLPVFGCLEDSAWNCIYTVYSMVMGSSLLNRQSQDQGLNIGIHFQANSRSSQIQGGRLFCILSPQFQGEGGYSGKAPKNLLSFLFDFCCCTYIIQND